MINQTRLIHKTPPYFYIGSKTNCTFKNGFIIDKFGNKYYSSTKSILLKEHLKKDVFLFEVLFEKCENDITHITEYERIEQLKIDKEFWSSDYYNKSYAISGFTTNGFANYHYGDNKLISLPTNHLDVLNGKVIAQHKNRIITDEEREKLKNRIHPSEYIDWSNALKGHKKNNTLNYHKPKTSQHKENIAKSKHKPIEMLDQDMNHIKFFNSIDEASELMNIGRNSISACCNGRTKTGHGYIWRFTC